MTQDEFDFLPLKVTHIDEGGRRCFDPEGKRRLIEACEQPGASVAGLALKAGVNANQLRKWILLDRRQAVRSDCVELPSTGTAQFVDVSPQAPYGSTASVRSSNSSLESGQWNSAARKRPVGTARSRPPTAVRAVMASMAAVGGSRTFKRLRSRPCITKPQRGFSARRGL